MHEILLKAYADGIVESLKARFRPAPEALDLFAAVDLGEDHHEGDLYSVTVKFYWESYNRIIGTVDHSNQTVLSLNILTGLVEVGYSCHWGHLTPEHIDSAADWLVQQEAKPDFSW